MNEETKAKLEELNYTIISDTEVKDSNGKSYFPKKSLLSQKAIRHFCSFCMGMNINVLTDPVPYQDIQDCRDVLCALWEFRLNFKN